MSKKFDRMLEKATAPTLLEPDWEGILNCVDYVRAGEVAVKSAIASIRKRVHNDNPHVAHHSLLVLEAAMKNCGEKFHKEIATKDFMEDLKHLAHDSDRLVKDKVLEMIQCWAHAFKENQDYKIICDTHNLMKLEGFEFPPMTDSAAVMYYAECAPEWVDADKCFRCREKFGLLTRKHHCRNCGQIFCDKCSSRYLILPHIGIEKEVRVCEDCHDKLNKKVKEEPKVSKKDKKKGEKGSVSMPALTDVDAKIKEQAIKEKEEEELQLAIAISQSEAEEKERQRQKQMLSLYNGSGSNENGRGMSNGSQQNKGFSGYKGVQDSVSNGVPPPSSNQEDDVDPELARYLNRAHWEQRRVEQKTSILEKSKLRMSPEPSAPPPSDTGSDTSSLINAPQRKRDTELLQNGDPSTDDTTQFAGLLKHQVEIFVARIRSNQARGRSIVNDSSINNLFLTLTGLQADVLNRLQGLDDKKSYYEMLQDRLANIQEARQAVDALREEHERKRQEELVEEQRRRQVQMQAKLEVMRQKKHEMLEQQRLMTLQRMQQQQQEIALRRQMQVMGIAAPPQMMMVPGPGGAMIPVQMMPPPMDGQQQMMYQPTSGGMMMPPQYGEVPSYQPPQGGFVQQNQWNPPPPASQQMPQQYAPQQVVAQNHPQHQPQYAQQQHHVSPQHIPQSVPGQNPPQGMPQQNVPPQGMAHQSVPPQGMAPQGMPQHSAPQAMPQQNMPHQGMQPPQGMHQQQMSHQQNVPGPMMYGGEAQAYYQQPPPQQHPIQTGGDPPVDNLINFD